MRKANCGDDDNDSGDGGGKRRRLNNEEIVPSKYENMYYTKSEYGKLKTNQFHVTKIGFAGNRPFCRSSSSRSDTAKLLL